MGSSPQALQDHPPLHAVRRNAGRSVQLGSTFAVQQARARTGPPAAAQAPASVLAPDELGRVDGHYDPLFYKVASATSMVFWSIYGVAVLTACALFFLFS